MLNLDGGLSCLVLFSMSGATKRNVNLSSSRSKEGTRGHNEGKDFYLLGLRSQIHQRGSKSPIILDRLIP